MTDQVLDILKLALLVLLYLFFARVLWAVWSEVKAPANVRAADTPSTPPVVAAPASPRRRSARQTPDRLTVLEPSERRGTSFAIGDRLTVGRETDCTIVVADDEFVSGRHVAFVRVDDRVMVDDLDSRNGTFHNGSRLLHRQTVRRGDRIQVGHTVLEAQ